MMTAMPPQCGVDWSYDADTGATLRLVKGIEWTTDADNNRSPLAVTPAPEEYRTLAEFKAACQPDFKQCDAVWRHFNRGVYRTLHQFYQACWSEPEAESIHAAWVAQRI